MALKKLVQPRFNLKVYKYTYLKIKRRSQRILRK